MGIIATLDVLLRGDTGNLDKSLQKSEGKVKGFGGLLSGNPSLSGAAFGILAGAASAATGAIIGAMKAAGAAIIETIQHMGELGRAAKQLGVTTEELAGLEHASALAGLEAGSMTHFFGRFVEALSDASGGAGEAHVAFARLGLDLGRLKSEAPIEAFSEFAAAIARVGNAGDKRAIAKAIGGREGAAVVPLLKNIGAEINRMAAAARGPALEEFGEAIVDAGNDARAAWPWFARIGLGLEEIQELADFDTGAAFGKIQEALSKIGDTASRVRLAEKILGPGREETAKFLGGATDDVRKLVDAAGSLGPTGARAVADLQASTAAYRQFMAAISGIGRSLAVILAPTLTAISEGLAGLTKSFAEMASDGETIAFFREVIKTAGMVLSAFSQLNIATPLLRLAFATLLDTVGLGDSTWEGFTNAALKGMFAIQTALESFGDFWSLTWKTIALGLSNAINWMVEKTTAGINGMIEAINSITPAIAQIPTIKLGAEAIDTTKLRADVDRLAGDFNKRMDDKMKAFKARSLDTGKRPDKGGAPLEGGDKSPAANMFGSKEAFHVLFGTEDYQKKAYFVANENLRTNKEAQKLLKQIVANLTGVKLAKADL